MSDTPICGKCNRPMLNQRNARHFGFFMAHQEDECLRIVEAELAAANKLIDDEKTGKLISYLNVLAQENKTLRRMSHADRAEKAEAEREALREALLLVLDQVDYTAGACAFTNMVGACLPSSIIDKAKAAIDAARAK